MKKCSVCNSDAKFRCQCSEIYFCDIHATPHSTEEGIHKLSLVLFSLDSVDRKSFDSKIISRLNLIRNCQNDIISYTAQAINQIVQSSTSLLQKIAEMHSSYFKLLTSKEHNNDDFQRVQEVLKTSLIKNYELKGFENDHQFYNQEFLKETDADYIAVF